MKGHPGVWLAAILLWISAGATAADLTGTVVIKRTLTKRRVTPEAGLYQRGVTVQLDPANDTGDALAFERSHVAVYVDGIVSPDPQRAVMEQKNRRFSPDLLVIPAGSTVSFPNLDPIFHNIFSLSRPKSFDLGNYPQNQTRTVTFPKPGVVFLNCHLHPNMSAAIVVVPNRWCARPGADGSFRLPDLPPGKYTVVAWHKAAGSFRQEVVVRDQATVPVQFLIPLEEAGEADPLARK